MRILVTGICGFVGSAIAECLLERIGGIRVVGIDNLIRPGAETNRTRIERLGIEFIHGDLRSASEVARLPACELGDRRSRQPQRPASPVREAAASFLNITSPLLEYCRQHRSGLLLLSSSRVYSIPALTAIPLIVQNQAFVVDPAAALPAGLTADGIGVDFCTAPVSLYGATKLASEIMALEYGFPGMDHALWGACRRRAVGHPGPGDFCLLGERTSAAPTDALHRIQRHWSPDA